MMHGWQQRRKRGARVETISTLVAFALLCLASVSWAGVDPESHGIANVIVWLVKEEDQELPPESQAHQDEAEAEVEINIQNARFDPHVALLRTTQTLVFRNQDPIGHNCICRPFRSQSFNRVMPPHGQAELTLAEWEPIPSLIESSIHPWMRGWVLIQDHPYMAVTDAQGRFEIKDLPAGTWTFKVWQEQSGFIDGELTVDGEPAEWPRGRVEITIEEGENNLGEILVPASEFER